IALQWIHRKCVDRACGNCAYSFRMKRRESIDKARGRRKPVHEYSCSGFDAGVSEHLARVPDHAQQLEIDSRERAVRDPHAVAIEVMSVDLPLTARTRETRDQQRGV